MLHILQSALKTDMARDIEKRGVTFKVVGDLSEVPDEKGAAALFEKRDNYAHPCPGTGAPYLCCGYLTSDVSEGCPFDCAYCILQAYLPHKSLWVSADTSGIKEDILRLSRGTDRRVRLGTGELSDSLAMDDIFQFTRFFVPLINRQERVTFEFKTKSDRVGNLLNLNPKNVIVSWSLNPRELVEKFERGAATVERRLHAANLCADAGYRVAFHFDPLIYCENYEGLYAKLLEELVAKVSESSVDYISLGTLRGMPKLFTAMRERTDLGRLLAADFVRMGDGKIRYFKELRTELLKFVVQGIRRYWKRVFIYLCMESPAVWKEVLGAPPNDREEFQFLEQNPKTCFPSVNLIC